MGGCGEALDVDVQEEVRISEDAAEAGLIFLVCLSPKKFKGPKADVAVQCGHG